MSVDRKPIASEIHARVVSVKAVAPVTDGIPPGPLLLCLDRNGMRPVSSNRTVKIVLATCATALLLLTTTGHAGTMRESAPFELLTHRMDVDVDGAPNAYGPPGSHALDSLNHAHYRGWQNAEIVGYLTDDFNPHIPVKQGPHDPYPGLYISQTAFTDPARHREEDVLRYVDATKINYVVLGKEARARGVHLGDFVSVYSRETGRSVYGLVGDDGNPSGDEGSLHLLQALGYPFRDGRHDAVDRAAIVIRYYPGSNPQHQFFRTQAGLDAAAAHAGLSADFGGSPLAHPGHPKPRGR